MLDCQLVWGIREYKGLETDMSKLSPFIKDNNSKINYHNDCSDNIKNGIVHGELPLADHYPYKDNESYYSSKNVKCQKRHNYFVSFFDNLTAMLKNKTVMAIPVENVTNGALIATPGTNTPTTNEVNKIFAPSKKKSEITSNLSLSNIQFKSTIQIMFCQGVKRLHSNNVKVYSCWAGIREYKGLERRYI